MFLFVFNYDSALLTSRAEVFQLVCLKLVNFTMPLQN